jgi:uncharacterized protein with beta-barrel porin domain
LPTVSPGEPSSHSAVLLASVSTAVLVLMLGAAHAAGPPGPAPQPEALAFERGSTLLCALGVGLGAWGRLRSNGNAAGLDTSTGGFVLGADAQLDPTYRIGIAGGFTRTTFDIDARHSSGSNESLFGALYGSGAWGALNLRLGAS